MHAQHCSGDANGSALRPRMIETPMVPAVFYRHSKRGRRVKASRAYWAYSIYMLLAGPYCCWWLCVVVDAVAVEMVWCSLPSKGRPAGIQRSGSTCRPANQHRSRPHFSCQRLLCSHQSSDRLMFGSKNPMPLRRPLVSTHINLPRRLCISHMYSYGST